MSVLKKLASEDTKPLRVRVSSELLERIAAVQKKARSKKMRFDLTEVVESALGKALKQAEDELSM